jgi:hypothetical protein
MGTLILFAGLFAGYMVINNLVHRMKDKQAQKEKRWDKTIM